MPCYDLAPIIELTLTPCEALGTPDSLGLTGGIGINEFHCSTPPDERFSRILAVSNDGSSVEL